MYLSRLRNILAVTALVSLTCAPERALAQDAAPNACAHVLDGRVVERFEGVDELFGVFEARVELIPATGTGSRYEATTDLEGYYVLRGVCPGDYRFVASAEGYATSARPWTIPNAQGVTHVDFTLKIEGAASTGPKKVEKNQPGGRVKTETDEERTTQSKEKLEGRELDETRGASLAESLEEIDGVRAVEAGGVAKPVIHGMTGNRVLLLYDELRHEGQNWGIDHAPEIDPFAASELTVLKGASGVRYGPDAIAGVILVDPAPLPQVPGIEGEVHAVGALNGVRGTGAVNLRGGSDLIPGLGWRLQGSTKRGGALRAPEYVLDNTGVSELNASVGVGITRNDWGFEILGSRFDTSLGIFTGVRAKSVTDFRNAIASDVPPGAEFYTFEYDIERPLQEVTHYLGKAKGYVNTERAGRFEAMAAYQQNLRREFDIVRASNIGPQLDFTLRSTTAEGLWKSLGSTSWLWTAGVAGMWQDNLFDGRRFIPNYRLFSGGVFGLVQHVRESVEFEAGVRVDAETMETFQLARINPADKPIETFDFTFVTPSAVIGAKALLARDVDLSLNLSTASRAPSILELFVDGVSPTSAALEKGDQTLDPEQTFGATLDFSARTEKLAAKVTVYGQYIDGFINNVPLVTEDGEAVVRLTIVGGFPEFNYQQVDALFAGANAAIKFVPTSWLELRTRGAMVRARDITNDGFIIFIPPDFVSQEVTLTRKRFLGMQEVRLGVNGAYTAEQTRIDLNQDFAPPPDAFFLLGASFSASIPLSGDRKLSGSIEGRNLTNQAYRSYLSRLRYFADEPGLDVIMRAKLEF